MTAWPSNCALVRGDLARRGQRCRQGHRCVAALWPSASFALLFGWAKDRSERKHWCHLARLQVPAPTAKTDLHVQTRLLLNWNLLSRLSSSLLLSASAAGRTRYTDRKLPTYFLVSAHGNRCSHARKESSHTVCGPRRFPKYGTLNVASVLSNVQARK